MRLLRAIACELDFDLRHFDIDAIFVHLKLDADVFLHLPEGSGRRSGKITRFSKSLYGLKQYLHSWLAHPTLCLKTPGLN